MTTTHTWRILDRLTHPVTCPPEHTAGSGAGLCPACTHIADQIIGDLPDLLTALAEAARRDVHFATASAAPAAETPIPVNLAARDAAIRLRQSAKWITAIPTSAHLQALSEDAIDALRLIDRPNPITLIGQCPACTTDIHARRDDTTATCPDCHTTWTTTDIVSHTIATGHDRWLTPDAALDAISHQLTQPQLDHAITTGHIATDTAGAYRWDGTWTTHTVVRLGDVIAYLEQQHRAEQAGATIATLHTDTGIPLATLNTWARTGRITPTARTRTGTPLYNRADITDGRLDPMPTNT